MGLQPLRVTIFLNPRLTGAAGPEPSGRLGRQHPEHLAAPARAAPTPRREPVRHRMPGVDGIEATRLIAGPAARPSRRRTHGSSRPPRPWWCTSLPPACTASWAPSSALPVSAAGGPAGTGPPRRDSRWAQL